MPKVIMNIEILMGLSNSDAAYSYNIEIFSLSIYIVNLTMLKNITDSFTLLITLVQSDIKQFLF